MPSECLFVSAGKNAETIMSSLNRRASPLPLRQLELGLGIKSDIQNLATEEMEPTGVTVPVVVQKPSDLAEKAAAKALIRSIATSVIKENRELWEDVKEGFRNDSWGGRFGCATHMTVASVARTAIGKLAEAQQILLQTHIPPNPNFQIGWTPSFAVTGEIYLRASRVTGRW